MLYNNNKIFDTNSKTMKYPILLDSLGVPQQYNSMYNVFEPITDREFVLCETIIPNKKNEIFVGLIEHDSFYVDKKRDLYHYDGFSPIQKIEHIKNVISLKSHDTSIIFLTMNNKIYFWDRQIQKSRYRNITNKILSSNIIITDIDYKNNKLLFLDNTGSVYISEADCNNIGYFSPMTKIEGLPIIKDIKIGLDKKNPHYLFLDTEGNVWGSGYNIFGEIGTSTGILDRFVSYLRFFIIQSNSYTWKLHKISGLDNIKSIGAGRSVSFFINNEGILYTCGNTYPFFEIDHSHVINIPTIINNNLNISNVLFIDNHTPIFQDINGTLYDTKFKSIDNKKFSMNGDLDFEHIEIKSSHL